MSIKMTIFFAADIMTGMPNLEQHALLVGGAPFTYSVRYSERARRLRITISDVGVTLVLPAGFPVRDGEKFLAKNMDWVLQQLEQRNKILAKNTRSRLPKDIILLRGNATRVEVHEEAGRISRARIEEKTDRILIYLPVGRSKSAPLLLERWLRDLARGEIEAEVSAQARRMHASPTTIAIRDQRTRWGSCSSTGTLSFNWRLIMVPHTVMQYVVIHELAHMSVPNHSADFWKVVAQYYPAYKEARSWLRKNAPLLHPALLQKN
jgi:predicted metal-dependent hydrolase